MVLHFVMPIEEGQKAGDAPIVFPDTYKNGEAVFVNR